MSALVLALLVAPALAQDAATATYDFPAVQSSLVRPAADAEQTVVLSPADVAAGWAARADLQVVQAPLVYEHDSGERTRLLSTVAQLDLAAAWGAGNLRVAAGLPVLLRYASDAREAGTGLGDPTVELKVALLPREQALGLALAGGLSFPLGGSAVALGEDGVTGQGSVLADLDLDRGWLGLQLGTRFRPEVQAAGVELDDALLLRAGGAWQVGGDTALSAELIAETALASPFGTSLSTPVEALLGASHAQPGGLLLRGALGLGITGAAGSPAWRLVLGVGQQGGGALDEAG